MHEREKLGELYGLLEEVREEIARLNREENLILLTIEEEELRLDNITRMRDM